MAKFNFLTSRTAPAEIPHKHAPKVHTRAIAKDRYEGLCGHEYIKARQLETAVQASALSKIRS